MTGTESGVNRPSSVVTYWMPLAVFASALVFVISFMIRLPLDRAIVASVIAASTVFSGFFVRSLGKGKLL